jgi:hypothetical protein
MLKDRTTFALDLRQEVLTGCEQEVDESFHEDKFTELVVERLAEAGELEDAHVFSHRARGMQANGYSVSEDGQALDLLITEYSGQTSPGSLPRTGVQKAFRKLLTFFTKSLDSYYSSLEETSAAFDMALSIHDIKGTLLQVRLFLISDQVAASEPIPDIEMGLIRITHHVWDVERLYRLWSSGRERESIEIDFEKTWGQAIPCLMMPDASPDYATYLSVFPATVLVGIYAEYGNRLLERNVRSYLQARGKVNGGIRHTILHEPEMFLAFNNGISATAEGADVVILEGGGVALRSVRDFQIVNGGQTTATLYHASTKDRNNVSGIGVQVKLTVIKDSEKMDSIVPRISLYANSQNKIQTADFSANDSFHRSIEEFSRTVWAPAAAGTQRQTRWYYERARGQYLNDRERERTPASKRQFDLVHPPAQKFTKTELAKYENAWNMLPHIVSRGSEKNFQEFMVRLQERRGFQPDQMYFQHLVAKAILFRSAERLISAQHYGGYRANIVAYTLARIANSSAQRLDLDRIWNEQAVSPALQEAIVSISRVAHEHIIAAPGSGNVTEWCKKEECWKRFREIRVSISEVVKAEFIASKSDGNQLPDSGIEGADPEDRALIARIVALPKETWFSISAWAKETNNLQPWQRSLAYSLGRLISQEQIPSRKQAHQAIIILTEAERLGFLPPESSADIGSTVTGTLPLVKEQNL